METELSPRETSSVRTAHTKKQERARTRREARGGAAQGTERDRLVQEAMVLLDSVAGGVDRCTGSRFDLDELKAHAHESVVDVLARFDPSRGVPFKAFARPRMRGAIIDGLRKESYLPRGVAARLRELDATNNRQTDARHAIDRRVVRVLRGLAATESANHRPDGGYEGISPPADETCRPDHALERRQVCDALEAALQTLGREGAILRRHYFFGEDVRSVAERMGLSKSWGSRLHARGIRHLARRLAGLRGALLN